MIGRDWLLIPRHMHEPLRDWIEKGEPHPKLMGDFLRAVLANDLMGAAAAADHINRCSLWEWASFLYNCAPSLCHGSPERLLEWWAAHHPNESEAENG